MGAIYKNQKRQAAHNEPVHVLWIAPNFNHYKKRFLSRLVEDGQIELQLLTGKTPRKEGHMGDESLSPYKVSEVNATKRFFPYHPKPFYKVLKYTMQRGEKSILMPLEKKLLPLILWIRFLHLFRKFNLVSYNHPVMRSRKGVITEKDLRWTKWLFGFYDRIVFYTEQGRDWAVAEELLPLAKAYYANNTLDTDQIWQNSQFEINTNMPIRILFIGRLIESKRVDLLLEYFFKLKQEIPNIELTIIGDGPKASRIRNAVSNDSKIKWCGAIIEESLIAKEMQSAHAVFIPGEAGLSVVHAFAYGKPYFALDLPNQTHGPEIDYLVDDGNGLLLAEDMRENVKRMTEVLNNSEVYGNMCECAFTSAKNLSIDKWCVRMTEALNPHINKTD